MEPEGLVATSREGVRRVSEPVAGEGARGARDSSVSDLFFVVSLACVASLLFQGFQIRHCKKNDLELSNY